MTKLSVMRKSPLSLLLLLCSYCALSQAVNPQEFFIEEVPVEVTLTTDIRNLVTEKKTLLWQPADIVMKFSDTMIIKETIRVQPRGAFRKNNCEIASLMLDFKNPTSPRLSPLRKLKLVGGCNSEKTDEQLLLKEYLIYKMYNHLTNMSFRVRLLKVNYKDSKKNYRAYTQYAFLIEDAKDMAGRNNCDEFKSTTFTSERTNRDQMTLINLFQYMIGNTDWAVPTLHNMKLMIPRNDTLALPYAVPYDFDYCGLVDAPYAVPPEAFGTTSVKQRVYRGFPRTIEELRAAALIFEEKKSRIMHMIQNFELLESQTRSLMIDYIEDFYKILGSEKKMTSLFIKNARKE
jgi:hypothetical protein